MRTIECDGHIYTPTKIVCIGRNYAEHIKEMGGANAPTDPTIFIKPNSSIAFCKNDISIPSSLGLLHHEVELCCVLGSVGRDIPKEEVSKKIVGWGVGVDFTLREMQAAAKKSQGPWALSKGFDDAAAFGKFISASDVKDPNSLRITLDVNGVMRQDANTREMIFSPEDIVSFVSRFMTIESGDILMCGTPAGVGGVEDGDKVRASIDGLPSLEFTIHRR